MAAGAQVDFRGLLTTPQCHFIVQSINKWHPDTEDHYFQTLLGGFADATAGLAWPEPRTLVVDCANGVGAGKMSRLRERLAAVG